MKGVGGPSSGETGFVLLFWSQCILVKNILAMNSCFHQVESGSLVLGTKGATTWTVGCTALSRHVT